MIQINEQDILERLHDLERSRNRSRAMFAGVTLGTICLFALGLTQSAGTPQDVIQAKRFVVKDKQGRLRAWLGTDDADSATLKLFDKSGDSILAITVADDLCGIGLHPARGPSALLWAKPDLASLSFRPRALLEGVLPGAKWNAVPIAGKRGRDHKAEIGLSHGDPYVAIGDENASRGELLVTETGDVGFKLLDKAGNTRTELGVSDKHGTYLRIFDKAGVARGTWGLEATDNFILHALNDAEGTRGAWAVYRDGTTWIKLMDKAGNVTFSAP